jgi:hypothetical protein
MAFLKSKLHVRLKEAIWISIDVLENLQKLELIWNNTLHLALC